MDVSYTEPSFLTPICTLREVADLIDGPLGTARSGAPANQKPRDVWEVRQERAYIFDGRSRVSSPGSPRP